MKIGYARVSTDDQNSDLQIAAMERAGGKRIFIDKASGAHVKCPELTQCFKALNEGDTLNVSRFVGCCWGRLNLREAWLSVRILQFSSPDPLKRTIPLRCLWIFKPN